MNELLHLMGELEGKLRYRSLIGQERISVELAESLDACLDTIRSKTYADDDPKRALDRIALELEGCTRCDLHRNRKNIVIGEGNLEADIVFVGEGPGADEDVQGRPFVGKAGQLLTKIIEAMGYTREQVFIANIVKCRPPANRDPNPEEAATCMPFLKRQLKAISPKVIVTLGNVPTKALLGTKAGITKVRGRFDDWDGIPVMPTYHPSYVLRNEEDEVRFREKKRDVWEDMKMVMTLLQSSDS